MAAETKAGTLRIIGEELEALRKRIIANHEAAGQVKKPDSFAYLVARKIAKEGTELYRNRKHEEIYSRDLENTVDNIASRVSAIYETEVEHINLNFDNENTYDR